MAAGLFVNREMREVVIPRPGLIMDRQNPPEFLSDEEVFRRFRFRPDTIVYIVGLVADSISHGTLRSVSLPPLLQVLICLRFLATGSFQQLIGDSVKISQPTVSRVVRRVVGALARSIRNFVTFPRGENGNRTKQEFGAIAG
ncbi:putative nuclease HARBI1 [Pecten maximus]|uniref:putative nuclease HARBI1 n=1 Tax=Pecten maximus TaxID=6579 RepID=UPI001458123E|nr:putative nuclease HARBI1 [Pecten maximus]